MNSRIPNSGLRLPPFVTGRAIGELLNWANSIKREFRTVARGAVVAGWSLGEPEGDIYEDIVRLLARPGGGLELEQLVNAADGEKRRGLMRALFKRAYRVLGADMEREEDWADIIAKLQIADQPDLAAWFAFELLASKNDPDQEDDDPVVRLLMRDRDLRATLGDYWTDWLALRNKAKDEREEDSHEDAGGGSSEYGGGPSLPLTRAGTSEREGADTSRLVNILESVSRYQGNSIDYRNWEVVSGPDRITWTREIEDLRKNLGRAEEFDGKILDLLQVALERLRPLVARAEERDAQYAARLSEVAARQMERFRHELESLGEGVAGREELLAAAARLPADGPSVDRLEKVVDWAATARTRMGAATERRRAALERVQTDESDEAGAELTAANGERRRTRQEIDGEAAAWIAEFSRSRERSSPGDNKPESSGKENRPQLTELLAKYPAAEEAQPEEGAKISPVARAPREPPLALEEPAPSPMPAISDQDAATSEVLPQDPNMAPSDVEQPAVMTSQTVTVAALATDREKLLETALLEGRYGLAAHLQRAVEALGNTDSPPAPSSVLEALCIGSSITASRLAAAEHRYAGVLPRVLADLGRPSAHAESVRLLAFAGAIKPALFSMQTSAAEAIRSAVVGGLGSHLHELAEFVVKQLPKRGGVIDLASLRPDVDEHNAREEVERLRAELVEMADGASAKKAPFARASFIWRGLFQDLGSVPRAVSAVRRRASNGAALAHEAAEELERHLDERARELDRAAKRNRDAWLEGKALEWLLTSLKELRDLLHAYATAAAKRATGPKTTHTAETQKMLTDLAIAAREDVVQYSTRTELAIAAQVAVRVLDDVRALLDGKADSADADLGVDAMLDGDLLLIRPYPTEARARSLTRDGALRLLAGAKAMLEAPPYFAVAFSALVTAGRFDEAAEAAERAAREGVDRRKLEEEIDDARLARLGQVEGRSLTLRVRLDDLLGADTEGKIDPAYSVQLEGLIASMRGQGLDPQDAARRLSFPEIETELARLETAVGDGAELLLVPLRREIESLGVSGRTATILDDLANRRELTALREFVNGVKAGADMDLTGYQERLLRTFAENFLSPGFVQADPRKRNVADLLSAVKERRDGTVVDFSLLTAEDVPAAEALLAAWLKLKRGSGEANAALRELLGELRFTNVRIRAEKRLQRAHRYSVLYDPTSDRRDCPVPAFGSAANGRLEVLVVEALHVTDGVELHGLVKSLENSSTVPTLVIVTGVLPTDRRLGFMREARRLAGQIPCALLDEAGVLFLTTWPSRRRADIFAVALPGGGVQPYSDAPSKTSPEMFFGRSAELGELWRADGSCLVYGGRQLGKTALLQQVRLRNHKPPGQVVVYGSLQGEADVWRKVAQLLTADGVQVKGHSASTVEGSVRDWLREDDARRIVILVDEADTYLESEMQQSYPTLARVRDLMQSTERRCKFVFAGLHNVQRLARSPNSPLLHFGTPLRVGPLFGRDLGEAREMIVTPMAAAGIVFESATLPNRILSAVGFYPSLLQTFGSTLIERVNRNAHGRLKSVSPLPIVVTEHDIQNALEDSAFKENIREKFRKTLSLDERYRLITLAMLQRSLDRREQSGVAPSLTDVEVQALAREWWPQGFEEDSSLDAFQGLLQEMVGLGVLIDSGARYAIRSSRIAAMLGGKEQIEQELVELSGSPGTQKPDTGSLRRLDKTTRAPSPLTARQQAQLLGPASAAPSVHLALGSRALGLDGVSATLAELNGDELVIREGVYKTAREFGMQLKNAREGFRAGRCDLLVLRGPWLGREMIDVALETGGGRSSRSRALRVLISPTWVDWDAADEIDEGRLWGAELLTLSTLGRSGLGQWLRAVGAPETPQAIDGLRSLTGGYPLYLAGLAHAPDLMIAARETLELHLANPETLANLGLQDERLRTAAGIVAQYEPVDIAADLDNMGVGPGERVVGHLERLGALEAVQEEGDTRWRLNPFVAAVLSRQS